MNVNIKAVRCCALCRHWYDPVNSAIMPKAPNINLWIVDDKVENKCLLTNFNKRAMGSCGKYEFKLPIK